MQLVLQQFKHALQDCKTKHCVMILATCFATATTEDSRELIEHFNWPICPNCCETSCMHHCMGCCTGKSSKKIIAALLQSFSQRLWQCKFARQVCCRVCYTRQFFMQIVSQQNCETSCTKCCRDETILIIQTSVIQDFSLWSHILQRSWNV